MTTRPHLLACGVLIALVIGLAGCERSDPPAADTATHDPGPAMDHAKHDSGSPASNGDEATGEASGTIRDVDATNGFVTIQHGPFSGEIRMGAMTMGFAATSDVDLGSFAAGDSVAFRVRQERDGAFRILSICKAPEGVTDCLNDL